MKIADAAYSTNSSESIRPTPMSSAFTLYTTRTNNTNNINHKVTLPIMIPSQKIADESSSSSSFAPPAATSTSPSSVPLLFQRETLLPTIKYLCQPCDSRSFVPIPNASTQSSPVLQFPNSMSMKERRKLLKYKTELCRDYTKSSVCDFGDKCHYAHGDDELRRNRLLDLELAGLIDRRTHRVRPCFDWCATGNCPFGNRCKDIHDVQVQGSEHTAKRWLPLMDKAEFKSQVESHLYVEQLHHVRVQEVHNRTLFHSNSVDAIIAQVCNDGGDDDYDDDDVLKMNNKKDPVASLNHPPFLFPTKRHRIEIAMRMRATGRRTYVYKTNKLLGHRTCMVLQVRTFLLSPGNERIIDVTDDGEAAHNAGRGLETKTHRRRHHRGCQKVIVREIAFGASGDVTVPKRALLFNVPEDVLINVPMTYHFKRNRSSRQQSDGSPASPCSNTYPHIEPYFPSQPPFELNTLAHDEEFQIETEILENRLEEIWLRHVYRGADKFELELALKKRMDQTARKILIRKDHLKRWSWPVCADRIGLSYDTLEPEINSPYHVGSKNEHYVEDIWDSFVNVLSNENVVPGGKSRLISYLNGASEMTRGFENKPHLLTSIISYCSNENGACDSARSDTCWKSLLKETEECNDWDLIQKEVGVFA